MKFCSFLFLLSLFSLCLAANPGIKVRITDIGLYYGMDVGVEFLKQRLKETIFEDWHGKNTSVLPGVDYTISNIKVRNVKFRSKSASSIAETGIELVINDALATVTADWSFTTWFFRTSGRLTVYITGVFTRAIVAVSQDKARHTKLLLKSCDADVNGIDIQLDETSRWLYRLFANLMEIPLRNKFKSQLCPSIYLGIQRINEELKRHQTRTQLDEFAIIDYSLVKPPSIFPLFIDVDIKGTVYSAVNGAEPSFEPKPFILPKKIDSMIYIGLSEYFFHSASLAYYTSGAFEVSNEKQLSDYFDLTTAIFNNIIPMDFSLYGKPCPIVMNLTVTAAPVISLYHGRFLLELPSSMEVLVIKPNLTTHSMFTLNVTVKTHVSLTIFENNLIPTLCLDRRAIKIPRILLGFNLSEDLMLMLSVLLLDHCKLVDCETLICETNLALQICGFDVHGFDYFFNLSLAHSSVDFKASLLDNFMSYILQKGVIPAINVKLKDGIHLPVLDTMILVRPVVTVHKGYLLISTDVVSKPPGSLW